MKLPTLFKKTNAGADQYWSISVEGNVITTRWGQVGGAEQVTEDAITAGKNVGKKNETTPAQQAAAEAEAQWEKKLKKGYVKTLLDAQAGKIDDIIGGGVFPMLAHKYNEQGHKIVFPALAQPKFDGHRCIAVIEKGKATLWSRTRKPITGLPHIVKQLEKFADEANIQSSVLDGELYNHDYKDRFEELTSFIRNPEPKEGHEVVQYHVYDLVNDKPQKTRAEILMRVMRTCPQPNLIPVQTIQVDDEDDLMVAFESFRTQGYEGAMVRNMAGKYSVNKRSADLQKVKEFEDAEFVVTAVEEGRGKLVGHAIFVCSTAGHHDIAVEFRAKMKGKTEDLKKYFEHPELAIGKMLTVQFQGWTNKTMVPRFPVALRFRAGPD